ncbi:alpha/beta fold hydrolase [Streptomyces sp. NPDC090741]|uniref:alpha/beta fold hydrolase n=1 Tax=Streptomyces sp. NPDC090741 TaxID=3365967 RepID=UPI003804E669
MAAAPGRRRGGLRRVQRAADLLAPPFLAVFGSEGVKATVAGVKAEERTLQQIELDRHVDITDRLPAITAPTLVIGSTRDVLIPVEHSRELHAAVAGGEYAELESGRVVIFEKTAELVELLTGFLDRDRPRPFVSAGPEREHRPARSGRTASLPGSPESLLSVTVCDSCGPL